jgi:hypothetical protein
MFFFGLGIVSHIQIKTSSTLITARLRHAKNEPRQREGVTKLVQ